MAEREPQFITEKQNFFLTLFDYGKGIGLLMIVFGGIGSLTQNSKDAPLIAAGIGLGIGGGSAFIRQVGSGIDWGFLTGN